MLANLATELERRAFPARSSLRQSDLENLRLIQADAYCGIVHMGSLDVALAANPSLAMLDDAEHKGVASVLPLSEAFGNLPPQEQGARPKLWLVT